MAGAGNLGRVRQLRVYTVGDLWSFCSVLVAIPLSRAEFVEFRAAACELFEARFKGVASIGTG